MAMYVILTIFLFQNGASESRKPDQANPEDAPVTPRPDDPDAPRVIAGSADPHRIDIREP